MADQAAGAMDPLAARPRAYRRWCVRFLPVLGFWMIPLGALLIGEDIPPIRRVTLRMLGQLYRWWDAWRSRAR